ncbi:MAG: TylF/MycF family methyltransferase [Candidatus Gracilibacteria bacterium]|jgi:hypothetical protein|nr:TylF/MycF family methyltransferase [Candidatus Gracilibacteria bacterium]
MRKIIKKFRNTPISRFLMKIYSFIELIAIKNFQEKKTMDLINGIIKKDKPLLLPSELFLIYAFAKTQTLIDGDYAEVGVCEGGTAKTICEAKKDKSLYLFDTFDGLPETEKIDETVNFKPNMFSADFEKVKEKLADYKNVYIYKGLFPKTSTPIKDKKFAFVHLDVDLYQGTKDCLEFFYSRMTKGGIIISHDYDMEGVRKAFDEFFANKPEIVIQLVMTQGMVIKR